MNLISNYLQCGRLAEFIREFVENYNAEIEDKTIWELWLHKCFDKDFNEFKRMIGASKRQESKAPSEGEIVNTVKISYGMICNFRPDDGRAKGGAI